MATPAQTPPAPEQMVYMLDKDGNPGQVPVSKVSGAQAAGYKPAVKMVDKGGNYGYVSTDRVQAARAQNYAVTPDNPGIVKAVDYNTGAVNYILPQESDSFHSAGHAIVQSNGGIRYPIIKDKNGVVAQDPLQEQEAHQKVYAALNAEEKSRTNKFELKEAGKAGVKAGIASLAVAGAGPAAGAVEGLLAPEVIPIAGGAGFGGAAASETLGPALLTKAGIEVAKFAAKHIIGNATKLGLGYLLLKKLRGL